MCCFSCVVGGCALLCGGGSSVVCEGVLCGGVCGLCGVGVCVSSVVCEGVLFQLCGVSSVVCEGV